MPVKDAVTAQDLVFDAWEADEPARRVALAREALALDSGATDAYVILALHAEDAAERIALLREGVATGRRRWAAEIAQPAGHPFWLDHETRPFMRAIHNLALALWETGERVEAAGLVEFLLALNEDDNQGVRYLALSWRGALGDWAAVERLLVRYAEDGGADFLYARALDGFRRADRAADLLDEALDANPHVPGFLLDPHTLPADGEPPYVEWGSPEEAAGYARHALAAWGNVPGALDWLAENSADIAARLDGNETDDLSAELEELDALLDLCPDQEATMLLGELDGYLCGILASPHDPQPVEWLPPIWGGGGPDPIPGDAVRSARLVELVRRRKSEIAADLLEGGGAYRPVFEVDPDGGTFWQPWIEGFARSMRLGGKTWDPLFDRKDEDLETSLLGLMRFLLFARGQLPELEADEAELAPELLPYYVETIYRRRHGLDRVVMGGGFDPSDAERFAPVRAGPKVGRNDPCPCGSGKKFKKCCGAV